MGPFSKYGLANHHLPAGNFALLILVAGSQQLLVQIVEVFGLRNRDPVISAEVAAFPFDPTLLVGMVFPWIAKDGFKSPMRTKRDESGCLLAAVPLQNPLYGRFQIVIPESFEDSTKAPECQLVSFEESLLRGS